MGNGAIREEPDKAGICSRDPAEEARDEGPEASTRSAVRIWALADTWAEATSHRSAPSAITKPRDLFGRPLQLCRVFAVGLWSAGMVDCDLDPETGHLDVAPAEVACLAAPKIAGIVGLAVGTPLINTDFPGRHRHVSQQGSETQANRCLPCGVGRFFWMSWRPLSFLLPEWVV